DQQGRENQTIFIQFMIRCSWSLNGRITVVVVTDKDGKEKIVASTMWRPPIEPRQPKSGSILSTFRMGLLSVLWCWGVGCMGRISELVQSSTSVLEEGYKEQGLPRTPDDAWYLQLASTDPAYQMKGYLTMLLKEAYDHAQAGSVFTLEATTPASCDVYQHFGFEAVKEVIVAKGKVNAAGVIAKEGEDATGFPIYPMIKK
ncbi:hypothetical protein AN958_01009, partial [Leucoagaricus sp. SymC.cos]